MVVETNQVDMGDDDGGVVPPGMGVFFWWVPMALFCVGCCAASYLWHKLKQIRIVKMCLRCIGGSKFDDLWLTIVVHEVITEIRDSIAVRIRAGSYEVMTEYISPVAGGTFQETLNLFVEADADEVVVEVLCTRGLVAKTTFSVVKDVIKVGENGVFEKVFKLRPKMRGVQSATATLSLVATQEEDGVDYYDPPDIFDDAWLVERQLERLKKEMEKEEGHQVTEIQVLKKVCYGPLDIFDSLGERRHVFVAVLDPRTKYAEQRLRTAGNAVIAPNAIGLQIPTSQASERSSSSSRKQPRGESAEAIADAEARTKPKWRFAIWDSKAKWEACAIPTQEIDLLRISSVQDDPDQRNSFVIKYFDESRQPQEMHFRRIERSRAIWVESLRNIISAAHEDKRQHKEKKELKARAASPQASKKAR